MAPIPRWYCQQGHRTLSLLADSFPARFTGTLCEVEAAVEQVEQAPNLEAAADRLRLDIEWPEALRWVRRRVRAVHGALTTPKGLEPARFLPCEPTLASFRRQIEADEVLPALRDIADRHLFALAPPLGFACPPPSGEASTAGCNLQRWYVTCRGNLYCRSQHRR